jgi:hypothetical protein
MTRRMLRYQLSVDDQPHTIELKAGASVFIAAHSQSGPAYVDFWAEGELDEHATAGPVEPRTFQVFGTGQPLPDGAVWRATTARSPEGLVWHLMELPGGAR